MEKGSFINGSFFAFKYNKSDITQFSFVVPKKLSNKAFFRNSLRRRGYNILRKIDIKIPISGIFFYKKEGLNKNSQELMIDIQNIIKRLKI